MNKEYEIYYEAFDIEDADERRRFILDRCGDDKTLFDNIMRLFPDEAEADDDTYGKYKIEEKIGKGGMGVVYLASYTENFGTETFTKQVALKTISPQLKLEPKSIKIFLKEIKTLAELDHPNIARFLDIGTSEKGKPFFVMEYVDGVSILEHCNKNKLAIKERLEFFRQVMGAISYSHTKGFLHCDLKPNNIIVDSKGTPKVIDFGISSKYGSFVSDKKQTTFFQNAFTPNYASPEQIKGERNLSESADVYSLGVVLYELLTGRLPIEFDENDSYPNLISTLDRQVPPTLKKSVTKTMNEMEIEKLIIERDCQTISELKNNLSNSLDEIVQKSLNNKPHRRYVSVKAFDEEISDYLNQDSFFKQIKSAFTILYKKLVRQLRRFSWKWAVGAVLGLVVLFGILSQNSTVQTIPYYLQVRFAENNQKIGLSSSQSKNLGNSVNNTKELVLKSFNNLTAELENNNDNVKANVWSLSNYIVALSTENYPLDKNRLASVIDKNQTEEGCWKEEKFACKMIISGWAMVAKKDLGKPISGKQLEFILKNQSPEGWFPAYPYIENSNNAATYPTAILIWGLTEQLHNNLIPANQREEVQKAINKGVGWLLKTRQDQKDDYMWSDCPSVQQIGQSPSSGVDGTIVHVLHRVAQTNLQIPHLPEELKKIDSVWLEKLTRISTSRPLEEKVDGRCITYTSDGDILDRTIRFTFPWSIAATVDAFPNGTDWQKAVALKWLEDLPIEQEFKRFPFGAAELLIGLSHLQKNNLK